MPIFYCSYPGLPVHPVEAEGKWEAREAYHDILGFNNSEHDIIISTDAPNSEKPILGGGKLDVADLLKRLESLEAKLAFYETPSEGEDNAELPTELTDD